RGDRSTGLRRRAAGRHDDLRAAGRGVAMRGGPTRARSAPTGAAALTYARLTARLALPERLAVTRAGLLWDRCLHGRLGPYLWLSRRVPSWTRGAEAVALARCAYALPGSPTVVEVGSFLGASALLLAGARRLRGRGVVHCVDSFDGRGDTFSTPIYRAILA